MYILDTNLAFNGATTQYSGININSMCKYADQEFLSAGPGGLYLFGGDVDETDTQISARLVTATMDFGINADKHVRYILFSLEATGDLDLDIFSERVATQTYTIPVNSSRGQQDIRVYISRSMFGRFWTFTVSNRTTGADFSIDEIKIMPVVRTLTRSPRS